MANDRGAPVPEAVPAGRYGTIKVGRNAVAFLGNAAEKQRVPQSGTDEMESYDKITAGMGKPLYSPHESSLPVSA